MDTIYRERKVGMETLLSKIPPVSRVITSHTAAEPKAILRAMTRHSDLYQHIDLCNILIMGEAPYCAPDVADKFHYSSIFVTDPTRSAFDARRASFLPLYYSEMPRFVREVFRPDVAILHVSPPDEKGWCSFGVTADYQRAAVESAPIVLAQINDQMPRTFGGNRVHLSEIDAFVEVSEPLPTTSPAAIGSVERPIGMHCASLIRNGDCLQLGIGSIPDAVMAQMAGKRNLGIHSELLSNGAASLIEAGVINNSCKQLDKGVCVATIAMGTRKFYQFLHENPAVEMRPVDYTNDPRVICQQDNMVSINSCLQVDLFGQVAADTIGGRQYSGPGGQVDFVRGTNMSAGGRNIIVMPSTAKKGTISRISLLLSEGSMVTTNRFDVNYVITEYGIASLWGKDQESRAEALIAIAHPDFREELRAQYRQFCQ